MNAGEMIDRTLEAVSESIARSGSVLSAALSKADGHWAETYIGQPWQKGAHDCWGFVRRVYREQYGIDLPPVNIDADKPLAVRHAIAEEHKGDWQPVSLDALEEGDVVLMSQARHPDHVGIWAAGRMLHCVRGAGVVYQNRPSLARSGWNLIQAYRRAA